jgi:monoamine oxidase
MSMFFTVPTFAENKSLKVVVIGAGLAGLTTAYRLQKQGMEVELYEARKRVGGRVFTVNINGHIVELGAQTFTNPEKHFYLSRLIDELGLEVVESKASSNYSYFNGENFTSVNQLLSHMQLRSEILKAQLNELVSRSHNMKEVLDGIIEENDPLYKVVSIRLAIYEGAPTEKLSTHYAKTLFHVLTDQTPTVEDNSVNRLSIKGGNGRLPENIAARLGSRLHLNMRLTEVLKDEDGLFTLIFHDGKKVKANLLVLAFPCSIYDSVFFGENVIPLERLKAIKSVKYGTNSKILIPFPNTPSKTTGLINDQIFSNFDLARNILTVHFTDEMNACFNKKILSICAQARPMIKMGFGDIYSSFITPIVAEDQAFVTYNTPVGYSWPNDPYAKGSYSYISPGQETLLTTIAEEQEEKFKALFAPIDQTLYFAGEHTSILMEVPGTMEAACESGERTARMIAKSCGILCSRK